MQDGTTFIPPQSETKRPEKTTQRTFGAMLGMLEFIARNLAYPGSVVGTLATGSQSGGKDEMTLATGG
jgi:hypothetical protein